MFEAAVDGFDGAVGGAGVVEVGQDVAGSVFERSSQPNDLGEGVGTRLEVRVVISVCMRALPTCLSDWL